MKKKNLLSTILLILSALLLSGAAWFSYQKSRMDSTGHIPDPATEYLITQYADATGVQGTFYTISNDDTLIIIDGGWAGNDDAVHSFPTRRSSDLTHGSFPIRTRIMPVHSMLSMPIREILP